MFDAYLRAKRTHPDIDNWDATAIRCEYPDNADEINAGSICATTSLPWEAPIVFEKVALVMNDRPVLWDVEQALSPAEVTFAVSRLKQKYPDEAFNDTVVNHIIKICGDYGLVIMPDELSFAQPFIPLKHLSDDQQRIQTLYLREVKDYLISKGAE